MCPVLSVAERLGGASDPIQESARGMPRRERNRINLIRAMQRFRRDPS
jgi:hypothetical protein